MISVPSSRMIVASAPVIGAAAVDLRALGDCLAGRTEGEVLLHSIFDHVLTEEMPERLRAALDEFPGDHE